MQIKRFEAQSMSDALKLVKQEFGSDAVILSARNIKQHRGVFGFTQKLRVEVTAATDSSYPHVNKNDPVHKTWSMKDVQTDTSPLQELSRKSTLFGSLQGEVKGFKQRLHQMGRKKSNQENNAKGLFSFYQQMLDEGVSESIATELVEKLDRNISSKAMATDEEIKSCLMRILKEHGMVSNSLQIGGGRQKVAAFVGPTGVGKTTTAAKLAAHQALVMKKRVGFITLDHHRIGGVEQLKTCAKIMGIPLEVASNSEELKQSLKNLENRDLVLIDTAGVGHKEGLRIKELKDLFKGISSAEVYLTLSATTKEKDIAEIIDTYTSIPISGLVFTKLDETSTYGALLNQLLRTKVPLSYFTASPQIHEGIEIATVKKLAGLIVDEDKEKRTDSWSAQNPENKDSGEGDSNFGSDACYVANRNSDVYHYPHCKQAKKIKRENMIVYQKRPEGERRDLRPCRLCNPEAVAADNAAPVAVDRVANCGY